MVDLPHGLPSATSITCVDKDQVWLDRRPPRVLPEGFAISVDPPKQPDAAGRRQITGTISLYLLALFLQSHPVHPLTFSYAGVAQAPDGRSDVLDGRSPDGFSVRLFLDQVTHLPLMLSSTEETTTGSVEVRYHTSEFRKESGVMFPHRITMTRGGKVRLDLTLQKFAVNTSISERDVRK